MLTTIVACGIAMIVGVLVSSIINAKFTTDERTGRFVGLAVTIILIFFFFSDRGQIFLRRLIEVFPIDRL